MPRLVAPIFVALLLAALVAGCRSGGSSTGRSGGTAGAGTSSNGGGQGQPAKKPPSAEAGGPAGAQAKSCDSHAVDAQELRATGVACGAARSAMLAWQRADSCALVGRRSRGSCRVPGGYRCQAVQVGKGVSVGCAAPGRAIAFLAKRD